MSNNVFLQKQKPKHQHWTSVYKLDEGLPIDRNNINAILCNPFTKPQRLASDLWYIIWKTNTNLKDAFWRSATGLDNLHAAVSWLLGKGHELINLNVC